jgi:hypothetical protein
MKEPMKKGSLPRSRLKKEIPGKENPEDKRYIVFICLASIVLLGIRIYSNSFDCSFQFDDFPNIVVNRTIRNLSEFGAWWYFYPSRS